MRFCMLGVPRSVENSNVLFDSLYPHREEIEKRYGRSLIWRKAPEQESSFVEEECAFDSEDESSWGEAFQFLMDGVMKMDRIVAPYLK